jgi:DNA-binding transcriptional ArsR family regulator
MLACQTSCKLCNQAQLARLQFAPQRCWPSANMARKIICNWGLTPTIDSHKLNQMVKCSPPPLDRLFFALSDPTRRAIVARLAQGEITIAALASPFAISLVAVSKHIRVLEQAGLLTRTKLGREFHLRLVGEPLRAAADWIDQFEQFWSEHLDHIKTRAEQKARERAAANRKNPPP